jgi:hypothetical protein
MRRGILFILLILLTGCQRSAASLPIVTTPTAAPGEAQVSEIAGTPFTAPTSLAELVVQQTAVAYSSQVASVTPAGNDLGAVPRQTNTPTMTETTPPVQTETAVPQPISIDCSLGQAPFNALHITNRIILDGDVDAWYASFHEASNVVSGTEQWAGDWDLSAVFQTGWTEQAFYVVVRVTDERYMQAAEEPDDVQEGDSIDLLLDADVCGDLDSSTMNHDDFHLRISPGYNSTNGERTVYRMLPSPAGVVSQATIASSRIDNVTNYEIEIPWSVLGISDPVAGQMIRFALLINDNDDPQRNQQESVLATTLKPLEDSLDPRDWTLLELRD